MQILLAVEQNRIDLVQLYETRPATQAFMLLALDAAVQVSSSDSTHVVNKTSEYLALLRIYCHTMRKLLIDVDLASSSLQAVFGFKLADADADAEEADSLRDDYRILEGCASFIIHEVALF